MDWWPDWCCHRYWLSGGSSVQRQQMSRDDEGMSVAGVLLLVVVTIWMLPFVLIYFTWRLLKDWWQNW